MSALTLAVRGNIAALSPKFNLSEKVGCKPIEKIKNILEKESSLFVTDGLDFSFFHKTRRGANFAVNFYTLNPTSVDKAKIHNKIHENISLLFSCLDKLRYAYQCDDIDEEILNNLDSAQRSYIVERKLSDEQIRLIWQQAVSIIQLSISKSKHRRYAYHPTFTRYISHCIRDYLKPLYRGVLEDAKPELFVSDKSLPDIDSTVSKSQYILIPRLTVTNARSDGNPYIISELPAITALVGYTDRLCRNIKKQLQIDFSSVKV